MDTTNLWTPDERLAIGTLCIALRHLSRAWDRYAAGDLAGSDTILADVATRLDRVRARFEAEPVPANYPILRKIDDEQEVYRRLRGIEAWLSAALLAVVRDGEVERVVGRYFGNALIWIDCARRHLARLAEQRAIQ